MSNSNQQASKADVQSSQLNKLPVQGQEDTEFSAEEAANAFEHNASANASALTENEEEQ